MEIHTHWQCLHTNLTRLRDSIRQHRQRREAAEADTLNRLRETEQRLAADVDDSIHDLKSCAEATRHDLRERIKASTARATSRLDAQHKAEQQQVRGVAELVRSLSNGLEATLRSEEDQWEALRQHFAAVADSLESAISNEVKKREEYEAELHRSIQDTVCDIQQRLDEERRAMEQSQVHIRQLLATRSSASI
eukprot:PhM_4_TR982/c0_g1_i1/m.6602